MRMRKLPNPKQGEIKKDFIPRCIPVVLKEGTAKDEKQAYAICNSMYDTWNKKQDMENKNVKTRNEFKRRTARFIADPMSLPKIRRDIQKREGAIAAIAIIGDQFWNNGRTRELSSAKGLQEGYKSMDKTFHDLDHGADPGSGLHIRIEDIVGFHNYTEYNPATKEMIIYIYPEESMPGYKVWRAFMDLCERAGKTPNVSVEYMSHDEQMKASEIGDLVDYKAMGFEDDDLIWVEQSYRFMGAATVNMGACSDSDGCGIIEHNNNIEMENKEKKDKNSIGEQCSCADTDTMEKKMVEEKIEENIEEIAVKDRKIEVLKGRLQDCGKLRADLEFKIEEMESRLSALEPVPVVVDEEKQALEARTVELEEQLKASEAKLSKPVSSKQVTPVHPGENTGVKALRWLNANKIRFNTHIKGE